MSMNANDNGYGPKESQLMVQGQSQYVKRIYKDAQATFEEVLEINPRNVEAHFYLANIHYTLGQIGKGINCFKKVLEIDPYHTEAAICLSVLYNDIGKYEEAKLLFKEIDNRVKGKSKYSYSSSSSSLGSTDFSSSSSSSLSSHQSILSDPYINKKFAFKHYELGELYLTYDRYDEALFEYNKAVRLDPSNLEGRIQVAKVYSKKGLVSKAFEELRKLRNEYPNYLPARVALGVLYYGTGRVVEAQTEWQKVLSKDPRNPDAKMYIELSNAATETSA
ncbi:MAG: tetratricopeptide repeat protein [Oligoflexia bacterium]|nr:tetratricopeptide repeat protein [Oligoflexia bacterium]